MYGRIRRVAIRARQCTVSPVMFLRSLAIALILASIACSSDNPAGASGPPPGKPMEVGAIVVAPRAVTLARELPGRTSAIRTAEVRARVNGIVLARKFVEGSDVKEGQVLFEIDPAPYRAALDSANAQLARATAMVESATALEDRYKKLIESNAVSRQEFDDAVAKRKTAQADVAAAQAAVKRAKIDLGYTAVKAPIAGRIGRAEVTEGAYVQAASATLLATVQQLDKVYVDVTWSTTEVMKLRRALESGQLQSGNEAKVTVVLEDGRDYPIQGTLQFADVSVDPSTGSIALRAVVPNPKQELLPGMFVRARIEEGVAPQAILVPQKAVSRDQNGRPQVMVVDAQNKVERRSIEAERAVGDAWLVTKGLAAGERVVVEGLQKIRPGAPVTIAPPKAAGSGSAAKGP